MFTTDCQFLENELLDVVRLFKRRPETLSHSFRFQEGVFHNAFCVDGEEYSFQDREQVRDELEFKRFERRFAKLRLYGILSEKYGEEMPWGALTEFARPSLRTPNKNAAAILKGSFPKCGFAKKTLRWWKVF